MEGDIRYASSQRQLRLAALVNLGTKRNQAPRVGMFKCWRFKTRERIGPKTRGGGLELFGPDKPGAVPFWAKDQKITFDPLLHQDFCLPNSSFILLDTQCSNWSRASALFWVTKLRVGGNSRRNVTQKRAGGSWLTNLGEEHFRQ